MACDIRNHNKEAPEGVQHVRIFDDCVKFAKTNLAAFLPEAIDQLAKVRSQSVAAHYDIMLRQIVAHPPKRARPEKIVDAWLTWADSFQLAWRKN